MTRHSRPSPRPTLTALPDHILEQIAGDGDFHRLMGAPSGTDLVMYELHENEQYFFDEPTLARLTEFLHPIGSICCLCCPLLGERLQQAGSNVAILDVDERFAKLQGFRRFDIYRPDWQGDRFDIIVCDPPFYKVSLSQLFAAIRALSRFDFEQPLMVSYLKRRETAILGTFTRFGLRPSGYFPSYQTVQRSERNEIEFFTNLDINALQSLLTSP